MNFCSIFTGLPETFEVARYHSLHGIKDKLPKELKVTALSEDGIVMGIQHSTLPFAAVQFHPESILTSPAHGMTILENALRYLKYQSASEEKNGTNDDETGASPPQSGAEIVAMLEQLSVEELQDQLQIAGLSDVGSKSELIVRLALFTHKSNEAKAGRLSLSNMSSDELQNLQSNLGLKKKNDDDDESDNDLITLLENVLLGKP